MQPKRMKHLLLPVAIASALTTTNLTAATASYSVGFTTVPDIGITQVQAMSFGSVLELSSGSTCAMAISDHAGANYVGDTIMKLASTGVEATSATAAVLSGTGCDAVSGTNKGTIGVYEIQGIAGGTVNVTVSNITGGTNFNYTASGCVGNYNNAGNGDTCIAITGGTAQAAVIASAGDTVGNTSPAGIPSPGATRLALAGSITSTRTLTAGQTVTESFLVTVTY